MLIALLASNLHLDFGWKVFTIFRIQCSFQETMELIILSNFRLLGLFEYTAILHLGRLVCVDA